MNRIHLFARKHAVLLIVSLVLLCLVILFHDVMTPFIVALIVVYLIDPMVSRLNRVKIKNRKVPRGLAVLCAYFVFLLALTGLGFAFIPSLSVEISKATDELPKYFTRVKDEEIPKLSQNINEMLFLFSRHDAKDVDQAIENARNEVEKSYEGAFREVMNGTIPEIDTSGNQPLLVAGERDQNVVTVKKVPHRDDKKDETVLFTLRQTKQGTYEVLAGEHEIMFENDSNGSFVLKPKIDDNHSKTASFNLERELNKTVIEFVESSTKYAGSAISLLQDTVQFIVNAFIQVILVFMVAAFISIDKEKIMASIRRLFTDKKGNSERYDSYMERLTKGLSGVVRGQLIICCIDGLLTGIGMAIFVGDFAILIGIIAGVLCIVPIFGTIISTIPAVLLGLMHGGLSGLFMLVWIIGVHLLDTNFFTPKIVGSSSNLHPVIIIFALLAGELVAGVLGLLLAVPVASMLNTTVSYIIERMKELDDDGTSDVPAVELPLTSSAALASVALPAVNAPDDAGNTVHDAVLADDDKTSRDETPSENNSNETPDDKN